MRLRAKSRLTTCDADSPNGYRASHALRYRQVPRHLVAVALVLEARGGGRTDVIGQAADDAAGAIVELYLDELKVAIFIVDDIEANLRTPAAAAFLFKDAAR
jgi:hypothetical protein